MTIYWSIMLVLLTGGLAFALAWLFFKHRLVKMRFEELAQKDKLLSIVTKKFEEKIAEQSREFTAVNNALLQEVAERKKSQALLLESEARIQVKLDALLLPEGDIGELILSDIINIPEVQGVMDNFFALTNMAVAIVDIVGTVLVATGWQDICTKFHRIHPETAAHCKESDTSLSLGSAVGSYKLYRCKNNMNDISTPIIIGGKHLGNLFLGQFFFDDEAIDYQYFRSQANRYGFDEEQYIAALDKVPRWSREKSRLLWTFILSLLK